jgi:hypothetical protein
MRRLGLVLIAGALLAACNKNPADTVDDAALDAIGEAVETGLNEPGQAVLALLKTLDRPSPIGFETMALTLDQRFIPIDWWLWRRGYVQAIEPPPAPGRPTFLVTPLAREQYAAAPNWFEVEVGEPSAVDCQSPAALEALGCEVDVTATPTLTPTGRALASVTVLAPIKIHALVAPAAEGWEVREVRAEGAALHDVALNAILGNEMARQAARQAAMNDLDIRQTASFASPLSGGGSAADPSTPLAPIPQVEPVAPVIGDTPYAPLRRGSVAP